MLKELIFMMNNNAIMIPVELSEIRVLTDSHAYFVNYVEQSPNTITKIALLDGTKTVINLPVGASAPIDITYDGINLWVACYGVNGLGNKIICVSESGTIIYNITTTTSIVSCTYFNQYVYVGCYNDGFIGKINVNTGVMSNVTITGYYKHTHWANDGTYLYVHSSLFSNTPKIIVLDTSLTVVRTMNTPQLLNDGSYMVYVGGYLWSNNSNILHKIDVNTGASIATYSFPDSISHRLRIINNDILVVCGDRNIYIFDTITTSIKNTITPPISTYYAIYYKDNKLISTYNNTIIMIS